MSLTGLIIKRTQNCGRGLFTGRSYNKGEFVFRFTGKKVPYSKVTDTCWQISKNAWVKPSRSSLGYYLNHSCEPSCVVSGSQNIVARRKLNQGDEITVDYSTNAGVQDWKLDCRCKSLNCRKTIREFYVLPPVWKRKYARQISRYLLEK